MLERQSGPGDGRRAQDHDGRVAQRKHKADGNRALALLHELARDVVDGRNVVGIHRVAQAKAVGRNAVPSSTGKWRKATMAQSQAAALNTTRTL